MSRRTLAIAVFITLALVPFASAKWKEQVLYSFQGGSDGVFPIGGAAFDSQGNLYGATQQGGATNCSPMAYCGTVYQLTSPIKKGAPWTETVLHVFQGKAFNDGEFPQGGVIADASGNIYGTTGYGGTGGCVLLGITGGCGTVYELSPPHTQGGSWAYTILYSFQGGKDGYVPAGDLLFDSAGNLYGATYFGGGKGSTCDPGYYQYCGTIFELSPPRKAGGAWAEKILHSFAGGSDGGNPNGGLVLDSKGMIYGTTFFGGDEKACPGGVGGTGCGTVFRLKPPTGKTKGWTETLLCRFNNISDGANPAAGVILDKAGNVFGTASAGGMGGDGSVFWLKKSAGSHTWHESVVHRFHNRDDGAAPFGPLVFDALGDLYGTASEGDAYRGDVFMLRSSRQEKGPWSISILHDFPGAPDGRLPASGLVVDKAGNLYGTTVQGGSGTCGYFGCGTVFELSPR